MSTEFEFVPGDPRYRRHVTDKWGYASFGLTVLLIISIALTNRFLRPLLVTYVNIRPSKWLKLVLDRPWPRIVMWASAVALLVFAFVETNSFELVFIAKRFGRQVAALLPALYLLTVRPALLPETFYLQLVFFHKFLSRIVVVFSVLHGIFYLAVYYLNGSLFKLSKFVNVLGIVALIIYVWMGLSSLPAVRRRLYEVFFQSHVIGAWISLPMLRWHSRPKSDFYLGLCGLMLAYQVAAKIFLSRTTKLRVQFVSPTLLLVTIPKEQLFFASRFMNWRVASHLRLSGPIWNPMNWVRSSHPYTIASLPEDGDIKLVIRPGDYKIRMRQNYTIFGPHRSVPDFVTNQITNLMVRRALLVVGGAGIAFGAPIMRYMRLHGADVRMVWVMRDPYDARALPQLGLHAEALAGNIEIYYTGESLMKGETDDLEQDTALTIGISENACDEDDHGANTIRSATRHPGVASRRIRGDIILSEYATFMMNTRPHLNLRLKSWLYGYTTNTNDCCCADRVIESCAEDRLGSWVMACGNQQLSNTAEKWAKDAGVSYFQDSFLI